MERNLDNVFAAGSWLLHDSIEKVIEHHSEEWEKVTSEWLEPKKDEWVSASPDPYDQLIKDTLEHMFSASATKTNINGLWNINRELDNLFRLKINRKGY